MKIFYSLRDFIIHPEKAASFQPISFYDFFGLLFLVILFVVPYGLLLEWMGMDQFENGLMDLFKENKWLFGVLGVVIAPIIEEPIFRLHLDLKKSSIWWSLILSLLLASVLWFPLIFIGYMIYLLVSVSNHNPPPQRLVVYVSAALFGLMHITNFKNFDFSQHFFYIPFLVAIQIWVGLVLSYIRLKHGMIWAILFHGVYNAVLIIPAVYFYEP